MAILIKSMGMPLSCGYCALKKFKYGIGDDCLFGAKETEYQKRPTDCPLIEVPEPHGDLIDRDTLLKGEGRYLISLCKEGIDVEEILRAKTVIPASEDG